ncbi:MAG: hypothetical protein ABEJ31_09015 [Haloarculaceae archaeon]
MHRTALPEVPSLDPGIQLLATGGRRAASAVGPLAALVVDHVLRTGGVAYWVDSRGHARTDPLVRVAPHDRALDRIRVARAFTAYQHFALARRLPEVVGDDASLVVLPAMDAFYRADDVGRSTGRRLLMRALATVATLARERDLPVLVTRRGADGLGEPLATAAERTIECRSTPQGPRFVAEDFETLVYPGEGGTVQTTLAFWRQVLDARRPLHALGAAGGDPADDGPSVAPGLAADGS